MEIQQEKGLGDRVIVGRKTGSEEPGLRLIVTGDGVIESHTTEIDDDLNVSVSVPYLVMEIGDDAYKAYMEFNLTEK